MKELIGKYASAKIFTDLVEDKALEQISTLLDQEYVEGSTIRIMPDVHAGVGCTIGTTMTIKDKCCPNLVGVDIGCGMLTTKLGKIDFDFNRLDEIIRECVPSGFNVRDTAPLNITMTHIDSLICKNNVDIDRACKSLGTLGGGNHFIEVDVDDDGCLYLVIHTGSRHIGLEVAKHYQNLAEKQMRELDYGDVKQMIETMKQEGRQSEIPEMLKRVKQTRNENLKDLAYVSGKAFDDYIHDMIIMQNYACWNRITIKEEILRHLGLHPESFLSFETVHNYIDMYDMILRKGAVSAKKGEPLLIPINMRDGSLLCEGKGNPDWNYSAPHGAGRLMSRAEAKRKFSVEEFAESMKDIYTTSVNNDTLDECPMAYKPLESIVENIGDTVEIKKLIRPVYNFKASE